MTPVKAIRVGTFFYKTEWFKINVAYVDAENFIKEGSFSYTETFILVHCRLLHR